ncbi:MAG: MdtA/MuxA family multidrug efflux RND transporter periplasmic adaptor subunit, partial [Planctomycetia bacterium]|nr:MdtA/MuxA family multidrug efflux RND transporter periplasmic adaptor subunit [Planctomycetia bacterium]
MNSKTAVVNETLPASGARLRWLPWLLVLSIAGAAWHYQTLWCPWVTLMTNGSVPPAKQPPKPIPVVTAIVKQRDLNLYLNGLGTVTAFKTVTIRSRVEGELQKVTFEEGQMIREGDLLAQIDPRPYEVQRDQAEGQLAKEEATLKAAKQMAARYNQLLPLKTVTQQEVDEQNAIVQQTEGGLQTVRATLKNAKLQLAYCRIMAPISGRIGLRLVDQGNIVRANDANGLAVITQLQPISLLFTIPQDDIIRVQKEMRVGESLAVDAFDRDFKTKLAAGKLVAIDNQVDPTTGTVRLKAVFENEDSSLFPNQFVNARLLVGTQRNALTVPSAAVQRGPSSTFVYVVQSDETVELRNIEIGPTEGSETSIRSGLSAGEIVVTEGLDKLQPGSKVATRDKEKPRDKPQHDEPGDRGGVSPPVKSSSATNGRRYREAIMTTQTPPSLPRWKRA